MDLNVRIAGEAGQGVQTTGDLLVGSLAALGVHVFSTQVYMSRIRGGLNSFDVRMSDSELFSGREAADVLIALNSEALDTLKKDVPPEGIVFFDGEAEAPIRGINFTAAAQDVGGSGLMANTVAAGAVFHALGYELDGLTSYLGMEFRKKGDDVVAKNIACARKGAELAAAAGVTRLAVPRPSGAPASTANGSEAVGLAAAVAGVKVIASYPMTPSTGVFTYLAGAADKYGIAVEQAEDEIAAINMVCGATFAGVPAMTTTSGGGFALMAEGLSLAGMLELPALIFLSQRPAPATGLPTRTGQEDLKFAINAGHGDFARAVYAPGTIVEAYALTRVALETAHKWQTPAIILADQFLADMRKNVQAFDASYRPIDRGIVSAGADYLRYQVTDSGVSPRAVPGGDAMVVLDSDEHTEDGHITENLNVRVQFVDKRLRKLDGMAREAIAPSYYGTLKAPLVVVCWGSTYGPAREAVDTLNAAGRPVGMLHFSQVWPLNADAAANALAGAREIVCVEGNATGQFAGLLKMVGILSDCRRLLKYNGLPFTGAEIAKGL